MNELFVKNVVNETKEFLDDNQKLKEILAEICMYYRIEKLEKTKKKKSKGIMKIF